MSHSGTDIVEWHRVSVLWRILFLWVIAICFLFTGMLGTGLHLFAPPALPESTRFIAGLLGWPSAVLGPLVGIIGVLRVLTGETRTLVVCRTGLRFEGFGPVAPVLWSELQSMSVDGRWPRRVVTVEARREQEVEIIRLPSRWIGLSASVLCERVLEFRRRALLGVVRPL